MQLPMATPAILLGVNQTVLLVLSMVVIAGLTGSGGLGLETVYGLTKGEVGRGVAGGVSIVLLAITLDRITQAWGVRSAARTEGEDDDGRAHIDVAADHGGGGRAWRSWQRHAAVTTTAAAATAETPPPRPRLRPAAPHRRRRLVTTPPVAVTTPAVAAASPPAPARASRSPSTRGPGRPSTPTWPRSCWSPSSARSVELVDIDENATWPGLDAGDLDAVLEVWPSGHAEDYATYVEDKGTVVDLGELGPVAKIGWYVPSYVIEEHPELATWEGLMDPELAGLFATAESGDDGPVPDG